LRSAKTGPPGAGLPEPPADCRLPAEHGQCQHCSGHPRPDRCFRSRFTHRRRHLIPAAAPPLSIGALLAPRPLLRVSDRCRMRTCASRSVLSLPSKADRRSARPTPWRCPDRACWNNRQVIPEILETYCNEKAEPRQKSTLDADSQRIHTQIVPFSASIVGGSHHRTARSLILGTSLDAGG